MNENISNFISNLKAQLAGLPEEEIKEAVSFYEEYLAEAVESGRDFDEIIRELDSPDKIAGMLKVETSIKKAQQSPGIKNFSSVFKNAFKGVTTPITILLLSLVALISYSMVAVFFTSAFISALAAFVGALTFIYECIMVPSGFWLDKAGTLGAGLMTAGLLMLLGVGLYRCARLFIKLSTKLVRLMLKKPGKMPLAAQKKNVSGNIKPWHTVTSFLVMTVVGITMFTVSGIPWKYFVITNSMEPEGMVKNETFQYNAADVKKISVKTTNTIIKVNQGTSDKIVITYEKADWLESSVQNTSGTLVFTEKPNGRLPLYQLVSLHEGKTELVISLPHGYTPDLVNLESVGGHIFITNPSGNMEAKTYNGRLNCSIGTAADGYKVRAFTKNGNISVDGSEMTRVSKKGSEYFKDTNSDSVINMTSTNGDITLN